MGGQDCGDTGGAWFWPGPTLAAGWCSWVLQGGLPRRQGLWEGAGSSMASCVPLAGVPGSHKLVCLDGGDYGRGLGLAWPTHAPGLSSWVPQVGLLGWQGSQEESRSSMALLVGVPGSREVVCGTSRVMGEVKI